MIEERDNNKMTENHLRIKYKCQHPDCQIKVCRSGEIDIDEADFRELTASSGDTSLFKSPRGICRLGFSQVFKALDVRSVSDAAEETESVYEEGGRDPIAILMEEHKLVLTRLDLVEDQLLRRDIEGLWMTLADIRNDIILHSIVKEEGILFPLLAKLNPLSDKYIDIMKEDHRELMELIDSVRHTMCDDDIPDNVLRSALSNLRSHISKEDEEFFDMINDSIDPDNRQALLDNMDDAERAYVPEAAGDRHKGHFHEDESTERMKYRVAVDTARKLAEKDHCH